MSRIVGGMMALAALVPAPSLSAQETESLGTFRATPPQQIDILADVPVEEPSRGDYADCQRRQDIAVVQNEIVVCGPPPDQSQYRTVGRKAAEDRYARETNRQGEFGAPDGVNGVAGPAIFRGAPTIGGLCVLPPCPPPPAYMIDFEALPATPPGSDADRVGRGLPPRGEDESTIEPAAVAPERSVGQ